MLEKLTPQNASLVILAVATATISGAWIFQFAGYDPCHLCLLQRWAYYFAVPFALLLSVSSRANPGGAAAQFLVPITLASNGSGGWDLILAAGPYPVVSPISPSPSWPAMKQQSASSDFRSLVGML